MDSPAFDWSSMPNHSDVESRRCRVSTGRHQGMMKSERYLQKAEEFAAMGRNAQAAAAKAAYEHLARSYRQLGLCWSRFSFR
jgi:hypothetical protein